LAERAVVRKTNFTKMNAGMMKIKAGLKRKAMRVRSTLEARKKSIEAGV